MNRRKTLNAALEYVALAVGFGFLAFAAFGCSGPAARRVISTTRIEYGLSDLDGSIDPRFKDEAPMDLDGSFVGISIQPFAALTMNDEFEADHRATEVAYAHLMQAERAALDAKTEEIAVEKSAELPLELPTPHPLDDYARNVEQEQPVPFVCWFSSIALTVTIALCLWRLWKDDSASNAVKRRMKPGGCS